MWDWFKTIFLPHCEKTWRIEGPADTNMQLMRELGRQESFSQFQDEEKRVSFTCSMRRLPSVYTLLSFSHIECALAKVAPHRCYLTVRFKTAEYMAFFFSSFISLTAFFAFLAEGRYLSLLVIPVLHAILVRFTSGNTAKILAVKRFFKEKLFVIDHSTAS